MLLSKKNLLRLFLNTLLGLVLILLWSKFINLKEVALRLKTVNLKIIWLFFVFFITSTAVRALRLKLLLSLKGIPLKQLVSLNFLAQFLSFIIPLRAGEIARAVYLTNLTKQSLGKTVIWVLLDRFLDFWVLIIIALVLGSLIPNNLPLQSFRLLLILAAGFSLSAVVIIVSSGFAKKMATLLKLGFILPVIEGFTLFRRPPLEFLGLLGLTILAIASDTLIWFVILLSLGVNLGAAKTVFGSALSILTFVIPSAPGYVGSAEAAGLAIFSGVLGIESNLASSVVILSHILTAIILPIFGIASIYFLKFDLNMVWKKLSSRGR